MVMDFFEGVRLEDPVMIGMRSDVLTDVKTSIVVFWVVMVCW
jgi:hypothetical protein